MTSKHECLRVIRLFFRINTVMEIFAATCNWKRHSLLGFREYGIFEQIKNNCGIWGSLRENNRNVLYSYTRLQDTNYYYRDINIWPQSYRVTENLAPEYMIWRYSRIGSLKKRKVCEKLSGAIWKLKPTDFEISKHVKLCNWKNKVPYLLE